MSWFFLISGLFLGWNLGANDAGNIYGTAISTKMIKFSAAAILASVFVMLGSMIGGFGTTHTLGVLGDVNAIAGSFTVAFSAGLTVYLLIKRGLVVSVSQAIIGAIVGWNIFTSSPTDIGALLQIVFSWVLSPVLAGVFSFLIFRLIIWFLNNSKIHLLKVDVFLKIFTIGIIAFGSYSLGANNIAKVIGVFMTSSPFSDLVITDNFQISALAQLFFVGALSIVIGIVTYSHKTTETVGKKIFKLTPVSSLASIAGASLVLFLFSSTSIERGLNSLGLPSFPLVPVSITQAIVGAVMGIGFAKGGRYMNYKILGKIGMGWFVTPVAAGLVCLVLLFIVQNVFNREVYKALSFEFNVPVIKQIERQGVDINKFVNQKDSTFNSQQEFRKFLTKLGFENEREIYKIFKFARIEDFRVDSNYAREKMSPNVFSNDQINSVKFLHNKIFKHRWMLIEELKIISEDWRELPSTPQNEFLNKELNQKIDLVCSYFVLKPEKEFK